MPTPKKDLNQIGPIENLERVRVILFFFRGKGKGERGGDASEGEL
jgi:hypothetical protein